MSVLDTWMTPKQLAAELGMSHYTLETWRRTGSGPSYAKLGQLGQKRGQKIMYSRAAVEKWLQACVRNNTGERNNNPALNPSEASTI